MIFFLDVEQKALQDFFRYVLFFGFFFALAHYMGCQKKPEGFIVTAHRGASFFAPENTLSAVEKAIELGADYAEIDVRQTKDEEIVLLHDKILERTTNNQEEKEIWEYTLKELKGLDAGSWFAEDFKGEPIPTLKEVIHLARGRIRLNIEIKVSREEPDLPFRVVDIIRKEKFTEECLVTSFDRKTIEKVKSIAPEIKTGLIFEDDYPADVFEGNWDVLSCSYKIVDHDFVSSSREKEKKIHVWTVNDTEEMKRLIRLKVDGIITDRPDLLLGLIR